MEGTGRYQSGAILFEGDHAGLKSRIALPNPRAKPGSQDELDRQPRVPELLSVESNLTGGGTGPSGGKSITKQILQDLDAVEDLISGTAEPPPGTSDRSDLFGRITDVQFALESLEVELQTDGDLLEAFQCLDKTTPCFTSLQLIGGTGQFPQGWRRLFNSISGRVSPSDLSSAGS